MLQGTKPDLTFPYQTADLPNRKALSGSLEYKPEGSQWGWASPLYDGDARQWLFACEHYFLALHRLAVLREVVNIHTLGQVAEAEVSFGR